MLFSKRMELENDFIEWAQKHNADNSIFNVITFLSSKNMISTQSKTVQNEQAIELINRGLSFLEQLKNHIKDADFHDSIDTDWKHAILAFEDCISILSNNNSDKED